MLNIGFQMVKEITITNEFSDIILLDIATHLRYSIHQLFDSIECAISYRIAANQKRSYPSASSLTSILKGISWKRALVNEVCGKPSVGQWIWALLNDILMCS
jgi:hypothetical protein